MNSHITLMTGIPRSGTTLCCKLLNSIPNTLALHEPIRPNTICFDNPIGNLNARLAELRESVISGMSFEHGNSAGLRIDNPVGEVKKYGIRQVVAHRGEIALPEKAADNVRFFVKQNAMFTALLPALLLDYAVIAIVRNPVDVILSWLTVDLPVNRGRIPGGERFDSELKTRLNGLGSRIERQWAIYQWFLNQYLRCLNERMNIVKYEDIISTDGMILEKPTSLHLKSALSGQALSEPKRQFSQQNYTEIASIKSQVLAGNYGDLYSQEEIAAAFVKHGL